MELEDWVSPTILPSQRYGRLAVLSTHKIKGTYRYMAKCQCDCGSDPLYVRVDAIRKDDQPGRPATRSCGCLQRESVTTHGVWGDLLFPIWKAMMERCYRQEDKRYCDYGGRGIAVCERWHDPNNFIRDMAEGYQKGLQIERSDNSKGYSPENCRWATRKEQGRNKRNNVLLTLDGQTRCISEWAEITGIPFGTIWDRHRIRGWSDEKTLTTPPMTTEESTRLARDARYGKSE